jgi:hypothetical protein
VFLTATFVFQTAEQGRDFFDYLAGRRAPPVEGHKPTSFILALITERGNRRGSVSSVSTYETYVDGLMASFCAERFGRLHMSGLAARRICPLALMKSDDQNPYQICELQAHVSQQVVFGLRWRPCKCAQSWLFRLLTA